VAEFWRAWRGEGAGRCLALSRAAFLSSGKFSICDVMEDWRRCLRIVLVTSHPAEAEVEGEATYKALSRRSSSSAPVILARPRGACTGESGLMELVSSESHTGALSGAGAGLVVGLTASCSCSGSGELAPGSAMVSGVGAVVSICVEWTMVLREGGVMSIALARSWIPFGRICRSCTCALAYTSEEGLTA
jgi:hypothetical protein